MRSVIAGARMPKVSGASRRNADRAQVIRLPVTRDDYRRDSM